MSALRIPTKWKTLLQEELKKEYFLEINKKLKSFDSKKIIYPKKSHIFNALKLTAPEDTRVIILGQDPYHGEGQAHGLSFSVPKGTPKPPSLRNIFKEINNDLGLSEFNTSDLTSWAKQGVLLLNSVLTVEEGKANSHKGMGWEQFTDSIIENLNDHHENLVFILWGNYAKKKGAKIDKKKHLVLTSAHPSPLSSYRGFFNNKHFSTTNNYLKKHKKKIINWNLK